MRLLLSLICIFYSDKSKKYLQMIKSPRFPDEEEILQLSFSDTTIIMASGYSFCHHSQGEYKVAHKKYFLDQASSCESDSLSFHLIEKAYEEHRIDQAYRLSLRYEKQSQQKSLKLNSIQQKLLQTIKMQMEDLKYFSEKLNQTGWKVQKEKKNVTVSTKYEGETAGVLVQAELDVQIEKFLSVMVEIDLMKKFMPFMKISRTEKMLGRNSRLGYAVNEFPILDKREAFFQGIGYDRLSENGTIFLYSRTLHNRPQLQKMFDYEVKETPGSIQLDYHYFVMEYRPIGPSLGRMKLAINVDLHLPLPLFILGSVSENFGLDFYKNVRKNSKNFEGSEWEEKMKENPDFFNFIQSRVKQIFSKA